MEIFGIVLYIHLAAHKLGHIGNQLTARLARLYKHLMGDVLHAAGVDMPAVFGRNRHFVGQKVDHSGIKHLHSLLKVMKQHEIEFHPFIGSKALHEVIVIAHLRLAVDEVGSGAVERAHA